MVNTEQSGYKYPKWRPGQEIPEAGPDHPIYTRGFVIQPTSTKSSSPSTPEGKPEQKEQPQPSSAQNAEKSPIPKELLDEVHENIRAEFHEQMKDDSTQSREEGHE